MLETIEDSFTIPGEAEDKHPFTSEILRDTALPTETTSMCEQETHRNREHM